MGVEKPDWFERAPDIAALTAFLAGAVTVIALAAPNLPHVAHLDAIDAFAAEFPELSASVGGVLLMALAPALKRRIDTAWALATALLAAASMYAFFRHDHPIGAGLAGAAALGLGLARPAFYRHSRLTKLAPGPVIALATTAALVAGLIAALLWAGSRPSFAAAPWWALLLDPHLGKPGRALAASAVALGALIAWQYALSHARGAPPPPAHDDRERAEALLRAAENARPDAELAFTGDKSFLFVDGAFIMHARGGGSLIAMGGPVGKQSAWRAALIAFRQQAEELSLRPVVYAAPPELLPDLIDAGFRMEKIGENALIDLAGFSLSGGAKQNLRTARRRFVEREHGRFEAFEPPHEPALWAELAPVSEAWLAAHGGREKCFSLGRFDPEFLSRHVIVTARLENRVIAFASLWLTPDRKRAALDLMRFAPDQTPNGAMDFLLTEMLLWAQREGLSDLDLGMAPLAGLADDQYAQLFARLGRFVYERAETFYGFQGLRKFKEKFAPRWEPRYLAAPGASWSMPIVLAETALLTSGGVGALLGRKESAR